MSDTRLVDIPYLTYILKILQPSPDVKSNGSDKNEKNHTSHFVSFGPRNSPNSLWPFGPTQKKQQPTPNPNDHCFHGRACCRCSKLWEVVVWVALLPWAHRVRRAPRQQLPPPHRARPVHRAPRLGRHPPCRDYPERVELGRGAKGAKWSTGCGCDERNSNNSMNMDLTMICNFANILLSDFVKSYIYIDEYLDLDP